MGYFQSPSRLPSLGPHAMRLLILLILLLSLHSGMAEEEPIRTIAEVRTTPHEEADKKLPVLVEGSVIYFNNKLEEGTGAMGFALNDGTASCWVGSPIAFPNRDQIRSGTRLRVRGVTSGSSFFPDIREAVVEVLGQGELPKPRRVTARELFAVTSDSAWVEVEAKIVGVEAGGLAFTLVVEIDGLTFKADVPEVEDAEERTAALMQRPILLKALVGSTSNAGRQMTNRHLLVPSFDLLTLLEPTSTRADSRTKTIGTLLRSDNDIDEEIRVLGVVTQLGDGGLYLKDETGSTFVQVVDADHYPPGSEVEVVGYAALAVFNAARHGKPGRITVTLRYESESVTLEIDDNGCGFDASAKPPTGHFGIIGMRERANKIHAALQVISTVDIGTTLRLTLPYSSPEALPRNRP